MIYNIKDDRDNVLSLKHYLYRPYRVHYTYRPIMFYDIDYGFNVNDTM